ncbi:MAG TPA: M23 family metallopeptidase, partial [Kofleriaceae bacterium]|nr:M23 family metallopeptidase [Kofleriaceae bacterium]
KRERPGPARLWLEPDRRAAWLARRAAVARMLERDLRELDILAAERDSAVAARDRARAEVREASGHPELPAPGSLVAPVAGGRVVAGFGPARDRATGAHLVRRGIRLAARRGEPVLAVARGRVEWTGDLAGAPAVVIDHAPAPFRSVLSDLADVRVAPGQAVAAGQELARAAGGEVYLEIRLDRGAAGEPIDPAPLLGTRPAGAR